MIDRKQGLMVGVFGGIIIYFLPMVIGALQIASIVFKIFGSVLMFGGVIYFIAYDVIAGKSGGSAAYDKDIKKRLKAGLINDQQAFEMQKKRLESNIQLEKKNLQLAKQRNELKKMQNQGKSSMNIGAITGSSGGSKNKMPNVLGNLGPIISGGQKKEEKKDDLKDLF